MRSIKSTCVAVAAVLVAAIVPALSWPETSVQRALDYLYGRLQYLEGSVTNTGFALQSNHYVRTLVFNSRTNTTTTGRIDLGLVPTNAQTLAYGSGGHTNVSDALDDLLVRRYVTGGISTATIVMTTTNTGTQLSASIAPGSITSNLVDAALDAAYRAGGDTNAWLLDARPRLDTLDMGGNAISNVSDVAGGPPGTTNAITSTGFVDIGPTLGKAETALQSESDPNWSAVSNSITSLALGAVQTEADPLWAGVSNAVTTQAAEGAEAHTWGDHAGAGYLSAETDPNWTAASNSVVRKTGDTMTGSLTTTVDHLTTPPTSDELATAGWVRSLAMQGQEWFFTSNVTNGFGEKTANFVALSETVPVDVFTNTIASPVTADTYIAGGVATELFGALRSPVSFEIYMNRVGGNTTSLITVKPEVYYVYDGTTNHLGDFEAAGQTITATTPTKYTFTVAFPEPSITGSVYVVGYLQTTTVSGTDAGLAIYGGGIYPSHMDISGVPAGETAADVAADLAVHTNLTLAAGAHGGESDPLWAAVSNIVLSTVYNQIIWNGSVDADLANPLNWTPNQVPTADDDVMIDGLTAGLGSETFVCANLLVTNSAVLYAYSIGVSDITVVGASASVNGSSVTINGNAVISGDGAAVSSPGAIGIGGDITIEGTGANASSLAIDISGGVTITGASAFMTANTISVSNNVSIVGDGANARATTGALNIGGDVTVAGVSAYVSGNELTINGNVTADGDAVFISAGFYTLSIGGSANISGAGAYAYASVVTVGGDLTITGAAATVQSASNITIGGNFALSGAGAFAQTGPGNILTIGGNFTIDGAGAYAGVTGLDVGGDLTITGDVAYVSSGGGSFGVSNNVSVLGAGAYLSLTSGDITINGDLIISGGLNGPSLPAYAYAGASVYVNGDLALSGAGAYARGNIGSVTIGGNATLSGEGASAQASVGMTIDGDLTLEGAGAYADVSTGTLNIGGDLTISGGLTGMLAPAYASASSGIDIGGNATLSGEGAYVNGGMSGLVAVSNTLTFANSSGFYADNYTVTCPRIVWQNTTNAQTYTTSGVVEFYDSEYNTGTITTSDMLMFGTSTNTGTITGNWHGFGAAGNGGTSATTNYYKGDFVASVHPSGSNETVKLPVAMTWDNGTNRLYGAVSIETVTNGVTKVDDTGLVSTATPGTDYLAPDATADGTYSVYNDGTTSGQVTGFTVLNGLITGVTVIP